MKVGELQERREQTHRDQTDYITKLLDQIDIMRGELREKEKELSRLR